jgi:hypothetical protein
MDIDNARFINERYKKIIWDLDDIIMMITNEIIKNEKMILKNKNKKKINYLFFNPSGYYICFSYLTKPYMIY